jgi:hypothetical protein
MRLLLRLLRSAPLLMRYHYLLTASNGVDELVVEKEERDVVENKIWRMMRGVCCYRL